MNIVHIDLDFGTGGAEKFIVHLSNEQSKTHEVMVVSLWGVDPQVDIFVHQLNSKVKFKSFNKKKGLDWRALWKLYFFLQRNKFDIVHTHRSAINYLLFIKVFSFKRINLVHTVHNDAFKETPNRILRLLKAFFGKIGFFKPVTISNNSNLSFNRAYGFNAPIIYNGTPSLEVSNEFISVKKEMSRLRGSGYLILSVGRISKQKNFQSLVKAVESLNKQKYDISLVIIGRKEIELEISLPDKIHLLGVKSNPFDYMNCADLFCLVSYFEGMPITLIESIQSEAVNVVTPVGGMKDVIENLKNGFITNGVSETEIKNTIKNALEIDESGRKKIILEAKNRFNKELNIENVALKYERIYLT